MAAAETRNNESNKIAFAVMVIDVQKDLADSENQVPDAPAIRTNIQTVIDHVRRKIARDLADGREEEMKMRLIFVQHDDPDPNDPLHPGKDTWQLVFPPDTDKGEWLISKTHGDVFESNPDLAGQLGAMGVKKVITCGLQTDFCVRASSKGALKHGFQVTLLSGAHSTYPDTDNAKTLDQIKSDVEDELRASGADILPYQDFVASL